MPVLIVQLVGGRTLHVHNSDVEQLQKLERQILELQTWKGAHLVSVQHPGDVASRVSFYAHQVIGLDLLEDDPGDTPADR